MVSSEEVISIFRRLVDAGIPAWFTGGWVLGNSFREDVLDGDVP